MTIHIERLTGAGMPAALPALARLRISEFLDWPYLYNGTMAYEEDYLRKFSAAIGHDLDRSLGPQQIHQHAGVVLGIPDSQLREHLDRAAARIRMARQRPHRQRRLDRETDLAGMAALGRDDGIADARHHRAIETATHGAGPRAQMFHRSREYPCHHQLPDAPPPPNLPPPPPKPPPRLRTPLPAMRRSLAIVVHRTKRLGSAAQGFLRHCLAAGPPLDKG